MKKTWGIFFASLFSGVVSILSAQDTSTVSINAYVDAYYSYDNNEPANGNLPYLVSSARHNDFSINLAMLDVGYRSSRIRGRLATGFGSYMNANYAAEAGSFRNIVEATAGIKLFKKKEIWLDAGIMGAPFSYENAISKDQLVYSRSLAAEGSPYYVAGVKLTAQLAKNLTGAVYVVNGWQQITDVNEGKSGILHIEYHPANWSVNLSSYYGSERQNFTTIDFGDRFFVDFNANYKPENKPLNISVGAYSGWQDKYIFGRLDNFNWWQANIAARYMLNKKFGISGRVEYFGDGSDVIYVPTVNSPRFTSFNTTSVTLCGNFNITPNALFRLEARSFFSGDRIYLHSEDGPVSTSSIIWASLAINFGHSFKLIKKAPSSTSN